MMKKALLSVALLAVALVAGCTEPIAAHQDYVMDYGQVRTNSYWLQTWTKVQKPIVSRVGAGQLEVAVPIRNLTDEEILVDYQYRFLNARGAQVEDSSGWHNLRIPRKGVAEIKFTSMTPLPEDFDVQIRYFK